MNLENYEKYVTILTEDLDRMFEHQKEHLCCKAGCSLCCERGNFPFSRLEFEYLMQGFEQLEEGLKRQIQEEISQLKQDNPKSYTCPFLVDKRCSVYKHRGLVCRTFGLLSTDADGIGTLPFCTELGMNYARYFDEKTKTLPLEKIQNLPSTHPPKIFNINLNRLMTIDLAKELNLDFGEVKALIEWF